MPEYRICLITQDNHIANTPVIIVCDDDQTAIGRSQKLLDRNDCGALAAWSRVRKQTCGLSRRFAPNHRVKSAPKHRSPADCDDLLQGASGGTQCHQSAQAAMRPRYLTRNSGEINWAVARAGYCRSPRTRIPVPSSRNGACYG